MNSWIIGLLVVNTIAIATLLFQNWKLRKNRDHFYAKAVQQRQTITEKNEEIEACDDQIKYLNTECNRLSRELSESQLECKGLHDQETDRLKDELGAFEDVATPAGNPNDPQSRGEAMARRWTT